MKSSLNFKDNKQGFTLLEVLIAATILALTASTCLGLLAWHKKSVGKAQSRIEFVRLAGEKMFVLPYRVREQDKDFPSLDKDEEKREFAGQLQGVSWKAELTRAELPQFRTFYRFRVVFSADGQQIELVRYL